MTIHQVEFTQETDRSGVKLERYRWICLACQVNGSDRHVHPTLEQAQRCSKIHRSDDAKS